MDLEFHLEASKAKQVGKTITVSKQKRMEAKRVHASCSRDFQGCPSFKIFLDHFRLQKTQDSAEMANPVTRIFVTWTAGAALHAMSSSTKTFTETSWLSTNPKIALKGLPWF